MAEMTPMMQQYLLTKEEYKDCILFYRLGDFYEMFFDDALTVSKELDLTLTGKSCGLEERAPMCGIPYHAVEGYLNKLVSKGYKVAICEQLEDPKLAKGLVKRDVVRIVTPGTVTNAQALQENQNNFLMCVAYISGRIGISACDVSTGEYYVTEVEDLQKLKEMEDKILNAEDKLVGLEYDIFCNIRDRIFKETDRIQTTAKAIARLDVYASLSVVAEQNHYVRPKLNEKGVIDIKEGRHPVVERMIEHDMFIPNDTYLDNDHHCVSIITGPNMAGKSTYMRQSALIVLMAQIGSFVPAKSADIGLVDRIFTRVGASDDLASGQSTFMVEMNEVANILRNATSKSLLILDEIGRGTSTYDGLAIAWAVIEHISNKRLLGAKTLFATHYHELTELEDKMDNVNNYCIAVKESGEDIVFLRKIIPGGADKSYGIQVARLAGVSQMVTDRAEEIAAQLSENDISSKVQGILKKQKTSGAKPKPVKHYDDVDLAQMSLFDTVKDEDVLKELKELDINNMKPLDALNTLYRLQNQLNNRW